MGGRTWARASSRRLCWNRNYRTGVLIYRTRKSWPLAFRFTYSKPCTILKFLSRAALQPDDFENPTILVEVSHVEERRSEAAGSAPGADSEHCQFAAHHG